MIAPEPATTPAIFILVPPPCEGTGEGDGVGETDADGETRSDESVAVDPKIEVVFRDVVLVEVDAGELLGDGLGDFVLVDVEDEDCDVEL